MGRRGIGMHTDEVALQIVDLISLRPEIKLRFLGIRNTCYEVVELRRRFPGWTVGSMIRDDLSSTSVSSGSHHHSSDATVDDEDEILPSDNDSDIESHASRRATPDDASFRGSSQPEYTTIYQLNEICSYDKVAIFMAKRCRL